MCVVQDKFQCLVPSPPHSDSSVQISLELPQFCFQSIFVMCYLLMLNPSPRNLRQGPQQLLFHSFHHCPVQGWTSPRFPSSVSFRRSLTPLLLSMSLLPCLPIGFVCLLWFFKALSWDPGWIQKTERSQMSTMNSKQREQTRSRANL